MKRWAIALLLIACQRGIPAQPREQHAFCGSTCWNNAQCTGIVACSVCVSGTCAGSTPVAELAPH